MEYLMNHKTHPTVDEIFSALSPTIPTLSKTTVYNTLNLFIEKGAAQMLTIDEKNARYDADISKHAHGYCRSCGKVSDIFELKPEQFRIPQIEGFKADTVEISFHGICTECQGN
jgi:Fur family ferric uptake transcriptional regulator/Fur family peroxide stress response transcriptional regulator